MQAAIGNVAVGSLFAFGQSVAANGAAAAIVGKIGAVGAAISGTYAATDALKDKNCEKDGKFRAGKDK